jgi:hypothetical protein
LSPSGPSLVPAFDPLLGLLLLSSLPFSSLMKRCVM